MNLPRIEKPEVDGYYWAKLRPEKRFRPAESEYEIVKFHAEYNFVETMGFSEYLNAKSFTGWRGPIPKIQETEQ